MRPAMATDVFDRADGATPTSPDSWGGETDWNLIRKASDTAPANRDRVWGDLIHKYQGPVRRLLRRHLRGDPEVEDATLDFFSDLFQKRQILEKADPHQGRFRCYIQGVIRRYAHQWRRGNGAKIVVDVDGIDIAADATNDLEQEEELVWAVAILEHALERLRRQSKRDADLLVVFYGLFGHSRANGEELAKEQGVSPATFHVALHRARHRLRVALAEELRPMVTSSEDMRQEEALLIERLCAAHPGLDLSV